MTTTRVYVRAREKRIAAAAAEYFSEALPHSAGTAETTQVRQSTVPINAGPGNPEGIMALHRHLNDPSLAKLNYDSDFGAARRGAPTTVRQSIRAE
jgi:hypothetical protein